MATSKTIKPTNESVSIPAMTDVPDASVFSTAISKTIDGVNKFAYPDSVSVASLSDLDTLLNNALSNAATNSEARVRFSPSATFAPFASGEVYFADLKKAGSNTWSTAMIYQNGSPNVIKGTKVTSGWTYEPIAARFVATSLFYIPENADLDNYNTPGVYAVSNAAAAATISHIPTTGSGGRLEVIGQYSDTVWMRQMYYAAATENVYTRTKGSSGWGAWYKFTMTAV